MPKISEEVRLKITEEARAKARKELKKKYGELFEDIPRLRKAGMSLDEIGRKLGLQAKNKRETPRRLLKRHFPDSLYPNRPENLSSTRELLELSGRRDPVSTKALLERHGFRPRIKERGELFWDKDARDFLLSLLNRRCPQCGELLSTANARRQYCENPDCRRFRKKLKRWAKV